jgi:hypothetical protein
MWTHTRKWINPVLYFKYPGYLIRLRMLRKFKGASTPSLRATWLESTNWSKTVTYEWSRSTCCKYISTFAHGRTTVVKHRLSDPTSKEKLGMVKIVPALRNYYTRANDTIADSKLSLAGQQCQSSCVGYLNWKTVVTDDPHQPCSSNDPMYTVLNHASTIIAQMPSYTLGYFCCPS